MNLDPKKTVYLIDGSLFLYHASYIELYHKNRIYLLCGIPIAHICCFQFIFFCI